MVGKLMKYPLYTLVYVSFFFLVILPVIYTFGKALFVDGTLLDNLQQFNGQIFALLLKSILIAFAIAVLSTVIGTVLGFLLYKTNIYFRGFFKISLLMPLFISPYIIAVAWKDIFFTVFDNTGFLSSYTGVILVLTTIFTPLSMLIIGSALSNINAPLEESGFMITGFRSVFLNITLPLIKPAITTSFVLVFIFSISEFSVPAFFNIKVFTTEIFTQFSAFYNHSLAILQSVLLIIISVFFLLVEKKYIADAPFFTLGSKGVKTKYYTINHRWLGMLILAGWFFISVLLPFIILFMQSFKNGTGKFIQAFNLLLPTFVNSIGLAVAGALIIVFVGFVSGNYLARKNQGNQTNYFDLLLLLAFAMPSTVLGISLIKFYNQPILDFIYASSVILLIGYVGKFSFISSKLIGNAVRQIPKSIDEAAQIAGINYYTRLQKIQLPLMLPALFAAFIISFIFSLNELGTSIMLYPPGTEIMPIKVFTIMANAPQALISSMSLIVLLITLSVIGGMFLIAMPLMKNYDYIND